MAISQDKIYILTLSGRAGSAVSQCEIDTFQHTDMKRKPQDQWVQQTAPVGKITTRIKKAEQQEALFVVDQK